MGFNIDGTVVEWPAGSVATISQQTIQSEPDTYVAMLRIVREDGSWSVGTLSVSFGAFERLPGTTDAEKSRVIAVAVAQYLPSLGLVAPFRISLDFGAASGIIFNELSERSLNAS